MLYNDYRSYSSFRTGHNAVNYWIMKHYEGEIRYVRRIGRDRPMKEIKKDWIRWQQEGIRTLIDFENALFPSGIFTHRIEGLRVVNIMILRDPLNTIASIIKSGWAQGQEEYEGQLYDNFIRDFIYHSKEFLRKTTYLEESFVPINYNRWFDSESYRVQIGKMLGLCDSCREQYQVIPKRGGGSSFDGVRYRGKVEQMDVLGRYKAYKDHPYIQNVASNPDIQSVSLQVFGMNMEELIRGETES